MRNYYRILGVAPYSEDVVVQAAYRALMRRYHPDTNKSPDAKQRAADINEAYDVLSNPAKRARYDAELKAAQAKRRASTGSNSSAEAPKTHSRTSSTQPQPPPPRQPTSSADAGPDLAGKPAKGGWIAAGAMIALLLFIAAVNTSKDQISNTMNADENFIADEFSLNATMNDVAPPAPPSKPPKLSDQDQPPVQFSDVEQAATSFAKTLLRSGIAGARARSESCHKDVLTAASWAAADRCAAFDYAAAYIDKAVATSLGTEPLPYFTFQADNQGDRYQEAGAYAFSVSSRLSTIKEAAEGSAEEALQSELARRERRKLAIEQQPAQNTATPVDPVGPQPSERGAL